VVGIVAAGALPFYQDTRVRNELVSAMAAAEGVKKEVAESLATRQPLKVGPRSSSSRLVQGIDVAQNGQITITLARDTLDGGKVFMAPYGRGEWRCWAEGVPAKFLPVVCREQ
jgi:Tfp pilus assembly major pilin PilA